MLSRAVVAFGAGVLFAAPCAGCRRESHAGTQVETRPPGHPTDDDIARAALPPDCSHALCGNHFFIDAPPPAGCSVGASCALALTVVATGDYHINDDYPYKFRIDERVEESQGIRFLGEAEAGRPVFSKAANDWTKSNEKTGTMGVKFTPSTAGTKVVAGTFKLSVCSAQNCQLEQPHVRASVTVR